MSVVVAIVVGALLGSAGFFPLFKGSEQARKATPTSNLSSTAALLLGFLVSFVVMAAAIIVCALVWRDVVVPFALALVIALSVTAIVFGFSTFVKRKK